MTRPEEPTEALPTRALSLPADPGATVDLDRTTAFGAPGPAVHPDPTVHPGASAPAATGRPSTEEPTAHLGSPDATVHLAAGEPTAYLGSPDATVHLAAGEPTAYLGAAGTSAGGGAEPTAYLGVPGATPSVGGPTAYLGGADRTTYLGGADRTAHLGAVPAAGPPAGTGPAARSGATDRTVSFGAPDAATTHFGPPSAATGPAGPGFGGTTGAYPGGTATARPTSGAGAPGSGGELRFGPGVPAAPPGAPAWPAVAPPRRPRPVWRRVVSVLSGLLTLALVAVVGLYLWQRLSPLEVQGVTVAVPRPAGDRCDVTVDVVATVRTNGRGGVLRYQWFRSDAPPGAVLTERVGRGQRTATLTLRWTFSGVGATTETATVNLIEPSPVQAGTQVTYRCRRG
ncbi:hypothetical protein [Micromonospora auratinigra]|uniref:Uncharacterized protein n=1 Tax=Micromonospora auratinigra TaxID=261654 RepID=A0A1A8ZB30_9ACTN|nr:hypothetical protein [Micromonospora auratinigra]SBT41042.1 hypothetical protein GA0070611_1476 [Micromonospora auratinigra]